MAIGEGADDFVMLDVYPVGESIALFVSSLAPSCRLPESVFELPLQVNETGFQLKHAVRPTQEKGSGGSCIEAIAITYRPEDYWPLKTASSITLHLPWGPIHLNDAALARIRAVTPTRPADDLRVTSEQIILAINRLNQMLAAGQVSQARETAEELLPIFVGRPAAEAFAFFNLLGMARRMENDLEFAATSFEVATMLAAMADSKPNAGVTYDNLATVRRLQKRWQDAAQASERAIAALEPLEAPLARRALGVVYNNRAMLLKDQQQYELALTYSEKALAILRVTFKDDKEELEPFLADNRSIRDKLRQP